MEPQELLGQHAGLFTRSSGTSLSLVCLVHGSFALLDCKTTVIIGWL